MHFKKIAAIMAAAITAASVSGVVYAADGDIFNSNYQGSYHEINNDDAFVMLEPNDVVLNAYYYKVGTISMYVRDVITSVTFAPASGTSNISLSKEEVELCDERGAYLGRTQSHFMSQGRVKSFTEITAHGKTYKR